MKKWNYAKKQKNLRRKEEETPEEKMQRLKKYRLRDALAQEKRSRDHHEMMAQTTERREKRLKKRLIEEQEAMQNGNKDFPGEEFNNLEVKPRLKRRELDRGMPIGNENQDMNDGIINDVKDEVDSETVIRPRMVDQMILGMANRPNETNETVVSDKKEIS